MLHRSTQTLLDTPRIGVRTERPIETKAPTREPDESKRSHRRSDHRVNWGYINQSILQVQRCREKGCIWGGIQYSFFWEGTPHLFPRTHHSLTLLGSAVAFTAPRQEKFVFQDLDLHCAADAWAVQTPSRSKKEDEFHALKSRKCQ